MSNQDHSDIDDLFADFRAITTDGDNSRQAVERTRRALLAQAEAPVTTPHSWWRTQMNRRSFAATALVLLVLVVALPVLFPAKGPSALAQLQERLKKVRSIAFETKLERNGKPAGSVGIQIRANALRENHPDGRYRIVKRTNDSIIRIDVDPTKKTAHITYGFPRKEIEDVIGMILNMPKSDGATEIAARDVNGRSCSGVLIKRTLGKGGTQLIRVWIDPDTKLPVYSEHVAEWKETGAKALSRAVAVSSNFKYDLPFDDSVFDLELPAGYEVTTTGTPAKDRRAPWPAEKLVLTVGQGIGPAKFGMSKEEVLKLLGEPEEQQKVTPKVREGFPQPELEIWVYASQGFRLTFSSFDDPRLASVSCRDGYNDTTRDFAGKTKEGIGLGATPEEVERVYGKPDDNSVKEGLGGFVYRDKRLRIGFAEGKVFQIHLARPADKNETKEDE